MKTISQTRIQQHLAMALIAIATLLLAFGTLALISPPAGAQNGCGTYSYGFAGTRLLNDGISTSAGPFAATIPAGTYTVTLVSHDHHDTQVDIPSQTGEQYHVVLDSGYVSPPSNDIPDTATTITTTFTRQVISASTTISVKHAGAPGINSVDVLCVGFTPEAVAEPVTEDAPTPDLPATPPPTVPPLEQITVETPAPTQTPGDPVQLERDPAGPTTDIPEPAVVRPETPVEPEVRGIVETPTPPLLQLAITGPSTEAFMLIGLGLALIALGGLLVRGERRFSS